MGFFDGVGAGWGSFVELGHDAVGFTAEFIFVLVFVYVLHFIFHFFFAFEFLQSFTLPAGLFADVFAPELNELGLLVASAVHETAELAVVLAPQPLGQTWDFPRSML